MTRILLLSVSAGAGHTRAADAVRAACLAHPGVEVEHWDVMDHVPATFRKLYTETYLDLVERFPGVWAYLYNRTDRTPHNAPFQRLRRLVERLNTRALLKAVASFGPDAIVCTHFMPAELLARERRRARLTTPVWVQVTDFDVHRLWIHEGLSGYFVASEEVATRLVAAGIDARTVRITGIPIMPTFAVPQDRDAQRRALGLLDDRPTILLMGGGAGMGRLDEVAVRLLDDHPSLQLVALAGRNTTTLAALQANVERFNGRLVPQGFTPHVERLMAVADLVVTKPGGLTTSECLAMGKPMVLNAPIPGQEERNADHLMEQGVAWKALDGLGLTFRVGALLKDPDRLATMRAATHALGRPDAAQRVVETVLGHPA